MKTGLVLEGGGMRGIYTAGILDEFMERGVWFDGVIGVSAGAIHGCSYLSNQKGRSLRYYKKYCGDPRFMSFRSWLKTGDVVGVDFCYHELPDKLDIYDHEAFLRCGIPFYVTCSDLEMGKAVYQRITDMRSQIDYLRASASLPYFSRIVEIDGKKYLDGGCTDSVPLAAFQRLGFERNVVILTREASYRKKEEMKGLPKLVYRKYPAFAEALQTRHIAYNQTMEYIDAEEAKRTVYVIRPDAPLNIGRLEKDPENVQRVYDIGRSDARKHLERMLAWKECGEENATNLSH